MAATVPDVTPQLTQCRNAVLSGIRKKKPKPGGDDMKTFIGQFKRPFEQTIGAHNTWAKDKEHILALARAIGALAEFYAVKAAKPIVTYDELQAAYRMLGPQCPPVQRGRITIFGKYCTGVVQRSAS